MADMNVINTLNFQTQLIEKYYDKWCIKCASFDGDIFKA